MGQSLLFDVDSAKFDTVLHFLWHRLLQMPDAPPDDRVGEVDTALGPVRLAIRRAERFAALAWPVASREADNILLGIQEAFFVLPQGAPAKCGWRGLSSGTALPSLPAELRELLGAELPLQKPLPSFTELAATLASGGRCVSINSELSAALEEARSEAEAYRQINGELEEEIAQLSHKLSGVMAALQRAKVGTPDADVEAEDPAPGADEPLDTLIERWLVSREGQIVIHSRALAGAKQSLYERPEQVIAGLEFLAGPYREHKQGKLPLPAYLQALQASGMKLAGSVGDSVRGEQGEAYQVRHNGRRRILSHHLVKGGGRDERYCLRIYFFFDEELEQPVVGWLPSHLANSLS